MKRGRPERERRLAEIREGAENGDLQAQGRYARNWEIQEDYIKAHMSYTIAAARAPNWEHPLRQRDQITAKMASEQLAEAERKAREWLATHPPSWS